MCRLYGCFEMKYTLTRRFLKALLVLLQRAGGGIVDRLAIDYCFYIFISLNYLEYLIK